MLTCIRKAFDSDRQASRPAASTLATIPAEDPAVYEMLSRADTLGVFQIESRAQMTMLPRLKPREFYDLVIEVAIVRPGPIQGDMVHPYLRRRSGRGAGRVPVRGVCARCLSKTLGVPLFQEQAMKLAIVGAGFTPGEADQLRRAMATFKRNGDIDLFRDKFIAGMVGNGYDRDFATRCFSQIDGFGTTAFPKPMPRALRCWSTSRPGSSAIIPRSSPARCSTASRWGSTPRRRSSATRASTASRCARSTSTTATGTARWSFQPPPLTLPRLRGREGWGRALRLGLRQIKGFAEADAERLVAARGIGYPDPQALWRRSGLGRAALERLAEADAFRSVGLDRRRALWALKALGDPPLPLFASEETLAPP